MRIILFLELNNVKYFGYIPEISNDLTTKTEQFTLLDSDIDFLKQDIDEINCECGSLIDIWDVDYLDYNKCIILKNWINKKIEESIAERYKELLKLILQFCHKAIELKTGVLFEL